MGYLEDSVLLRLKPNLSYHPYTPGIMVQLNTSNVFIKMDTPNPTVTTLVKGDKVYRHVACRVPLRYTRSMLPMHVLDVLEHRTSDDLWARRCAESPAHLQSRVVDSGSYLNDDNCEETYHTTYETDKFQPVGKPDMLVFFADILDQIVRLNYLEIVHNNIHRSNVEYDPRRGYILTGYDKCTKGRETTCHDLAHLVRNFGWEDTEIGELICEYRHLDPIDMQTTFFRS